MVQLASPLPDRYRYHTPICYRRTHGVRSTVTDNVKSVVTFQSVRGMPSVGLGDTMAV